MPFPKPVPGQPPTKFYPRRMIQAKLRENAEKLFALPIQPLIWLQYQMALTGVRHEWDTMQNKPVPMLGPAGNPLKLDEITHTKLVNDLVSRLLPVQKAQDTKVLDDDRDAHAILDENGLRELTATDLRRRLKALTAPAPEPRKEEADAVPNPDATTEQDQATPPA